MKAQAIIPLNPRGEKEPPAGMTTNGTPCCSMGFAMTYWGADNDVVKFDVKEDLRRYCSPHRDTKRWKELYNERTRVERCNSRLKTYLTADDLHVWSIQKVTTHQYLNAIILLVSALSLATRKISKDA